MKRLPPRTTRTYTRFPYTTLFRSYRRHRDDAGDLVRAVGHRVAPLREGDVGHVLIRALGDLHRQLLAGLDVLGESPLLAQFLVLGVAGPAEPGFPAAHAQHHVSEARKSAA